MRVIVFILIYLISLNSSSDLVPLHDDELSEETAGALGFALEDFSFSTKGAVATFSGLEDSNNEEVIADWREFYIYGEGSNYGSKELATDIGSYNHPWVIRSVRGGSPEYSAFSDNIALLELKTDSYKSPLQDSASFILHNRYQGCIWGYRGCGDNSSPFEAVNNIDGEISGYRIEYSGLINTYESAYGSDVASTLLSEAEAVNRPGGVVYESQRIIDERQEQLSLAIRRYEQANPSQYDSAKDAAGREYREVVDFYEQTDESVEVGQKFDCGLWGFGCSSEERAYNDQVDDWTAANEVVADIESNWEDENLSLALANREYAEVLTGEDSRDASGRTLGERLSDSSRFQVLCGDSANDDTCDDGRISQRVDERGIVNDIAMAISSGQVRRQGMDVGSRFRFDVLNENQNTGGLTRVENYLSFELRGLYIDGAYIRLWSVEDPELGLSELNGELSLRFFAKQYAISACGVECEINPEDGLLAVQQKTELRDRTALKLNNYLYDLNLGYGDIQPMKFGVTSDGNFLFEMGMPDFSTTGKPRTVENVREFFNNYYDNAPKSSLIVGQLQIGSAPESGPNHGDLGSIRIEGLRAQYLRIESFDLN